MNPHFRVGIIGCGRIAARHVDACVGTHGVELAALIDRSEANARALKDRFHVSPLVTEDLSDVLGRIDGAIIATPNHIHAPVAIACLESRIPVLIEKPLAATVRECETICRAAEDSGATAAVAYVTRFRESVRLMKRLLDTGYFGAVRRFAYQSGTNGGWSPLSNYNLDRKATGGGVLVVTGTHFLDRMLDWFGYPDGAFLEHDSLGGPDANAAATFDWAGGLRGIARFSKTVKLPSGFVMETEAGTVLLGDDPADTIRLRPADRPDLEITINPREAVQEQPADDTAALFRRQLEDFVAACRDRREPMVPVRQGLDSLRLIEQLYESAAGTCGRDEAVTAREVAVA